MKRHLTSFTLLMLNILPILAYDRHGRDYSVRDGGGSSGFLLVFLVGAFFLYCLFSSKREDNTKK